MCHVKRLAFFRVYHLLIEFLPEVSFDYPRERRKIDQEILRSIPGVARRSFSNIADQCVNIGTSLL